MGAKHASTPTIDTMIRDRSMWPVLRQHILDLMSTEQMPVRRYIELLNEHRDFAIWLASANDAGPRLN
jgi:hypothetical protein